MKEKKKSRPVLPSQKTNPLLLYHKTAKAFNPKQELFAERKIASLIVASFCQTLVAYAAAAYISFAVL